MLKKKKKKKKKREQHRVLSTSTCVIFKEWRVMNNADRGGVIVLFVL